MEKIIFMSLLFFLISACKSDHPKAKVVQLEDVEILGIISNDSISINTTISLNTAEHDWGDITEGDKVRCEFIVTNTGNAPLVIRNFKTSCGCLIPFSPAEPIPPGEEAILGLEFNSKGKKGVQTKTATLTANTIPEHTIFTMYAVVLEREK